MSQNFRGSLRLGGGTENDLEFNKMMFLVEYGQKLLCGSQDVRDGLRTIQTMIVDDNQNEKLTYFFIKVQVRKKLEKKKYFRVYGVKIIIFGSQDVLRQLLRPLQPIRLNKMSRKLALKCFRYGKV